MNLIYIHTHDSGRVFSPYGYAVPSDHLLDFAKEATTFTNAYCVNPTCSPSRAGLLTGTWPHQNGMLGLAQRGFGLNDPEKHLCRFLKRNGYHTVLSGVQHEVDFYLNVDSSNTLGYDEVLTHNPKQYRQEDLHLWDEENADEVIQFLERRKKDQPFFISYGMHSTHRPFPIEVDQQVDENYVKPCSPIFNNEENRHDYAQYLTSAKNADACFGRIIEALKKNDLLEQTVILFTTDHGVPYPYNKCSLSDKGIGVSLIMRVPHSIMQGKVSDALLSHIDVFPTLCDLLNLEHPDYLEGRSFAKIFEGEKEADPYIFAEVNFHTSYEPIRCVRAERYKYIRYYDTTHLKTNPSNSDSSVPKDFYLKHGFAEANKDEEALYDLYYDPDEKNNLIDAPELQSIKEELRHQLKQFQIKTQDPLLQGKLPILPTYKVNRPSCLDASSKNPEDYEPEGCYYINKNH